MRSQTVNVIPLINDVFPNLSQFAEIRTVFTIHYILTFLVSDYASDEPVIGGVLFAPIN